MFGILKLLIIFVKNKIMKKVTCVKNGCWEFDELNLTPHTFF